MSLLRHIVFPYSFSEQDHRIVPYVRALAIRFGAKVTLLSVVPPTFETVPEAMGGPSIRSGETSLDWRRNLQARLDGQLAGEFPGLVVDRVADSGDPAARIVQFAREQRADLIMMPTHGVSALRTLLVGSVTSKVVHDAACPVWTSAHAATQTAADLPRTILCAIDESDANARILRWAAEFARTAGAALTLVHVVVPVSDALAIESERRLQEMMRAEACATLGSRLGSLGVAAPLTVAVGDIVETVVNRATELGADLVVIGRGLMPAPLGRLRTHAYGVIQRSPCPVLTV